MKRFQFQSAEGNHYVEAESLADIIGPDAARLAAANANGRKSILAEKQLAKFFRHADGRAVQEVPFQGSGNHAPAR